MEYKTVAAGFRIQELGIGAKKMLSILTPKSLFLTLLLMMCAIPAHAHHVLGRPAYSLNEDSNTPPSMNIETQIGDYFVTAMVYPAFPRPGQPGRINFYATHLDTNQPLNAGVTFKVRDDSWFASSEEKLGAQVLDDSVYRQGFIFSKDGDYIITAEFQADGEPYSIDFPLRVGNPTPIGPLGITVAVIIFVLFGVSVVQRKRLMRAKLQAGRSEQETNSGSAS